ncbi:hypothetical protein SFRURICE_018587 [Spodoptera frugiperda]|nr:hypothetical protein SFRURICE_018587 [Spodoptera frugiperda]
MVLNSPRTEPRVLDRSLFTLLMSATEVIGDVADNMYSDHYQWQRNMMGHTFSIAPTDCPDTAGGSCILHVVRNWLRCHEDAQIMIASILVVVGLWWMVRAILSLFINLICPLLVVVLAVVSMRTPTSGAALRSKLPPTCKPDKNHTPENG